MENEDKNVVASDMYRLLSQAIAYPDAERHERVREMLLSLDSVDLPDRKWTDIVRKLRLLHPDATTLQTEYSRVFIQGGLAITESHVLSRYNAVSEVSAFYAAFGLSPKSGETPDSLMYQLEFAAVLKLKESLARDKESASVTREIFSGFLTGHLTEFAGKFNEMMQNGDALPYYKTLTESILAFVEADSLLYNSVTQ
ncbi:TorD/DmsD family molecular chaperone [Candidatus Pollutiaquabacter sp.]|uniref:TorD/DmsD family molecular chaperone n=1 Tax=Candidatus Pollutiaquabacter sp. TaxID=3416354 RepID=UPI003CACFB06|nr:molecular chaperone TorD family protein [Bacteroidota bacterium]